MKNRGDSLKGFTMIEVLTALAILGLATVVLGAAYANTLAAQRAAARSGLESQGLQALRDNVLNEPERRKVEKGGELSYSAGDRLIWRTVIHETPLPDLFDVEVWWRFASAGGDERSCRFRLLRPDWSDSSDRERRRAEWRKQHPENER